MGWERCLGLGGFVGLQGLLAALWLGGGLLLPAEKELLVSLGLLGLCILAGLMFSARPGLIRLAFLY